MIEYGRALVGHPRNKAQDRMWYEKHVETAVSTSRGPTSAIQVKKHSSIKTGYNQILC